MTPEQEADIRAKARRLQELRDKLRLAEANATINIANPWPNTAKRMAAVEERALLEVEAERAYLALRAAQEAAAKEGTTP